MAEMSFTCSGCTRSFETSKALDQHIRDMPDDHVSRTCQPCNRTFQNQEALEQHIADSKAHKVKYPGNQCGRNFSNERGLQDHLVSPLHVRETPLDRFFQSFSDFDYNPFSSPSKEMRRLQKTQAWAKGSQESDEAWNQYKEALVLEFNSWYGTDNHNLASWQNLCMILRIYPIPQTCSSCRKAVRSCHVNMVDLISHKRGNLAEVRIFPTLNSLRKYTINTKRFFPRESLEAGALLKHLLREILGH